MSETTRDLGHRTSDIGYNNQTYLIIGGGIGGLSLAHRLRQSGVDAARITLCDASDRLGGIIQSTRRDGYLIEHGPDSILRTKPAGIALWEELGLNEDIVGTEPDSRRALIAQGNHLHAVPEGLYLMAPGKLRPLFTTPLLSFSGKMRAALDLVLPRRAVDADEESLAQFVRRRFGNQLFERIAQPMVAGIFTADAEKLSVAATMPQFLAWEQEYRSLILAARSRQREAANGPRYGLFASLRDGLHGCVAALEQRLTGIDLRRSCPVRSLRREGHTWCAETASGSLRASRLAICAPAHVGAELLREADSTLAEELAGIPYAGAAILNLAVRRSSLPNLPTAAGFVVPAREGRSVLAATFMSVKYAGRAPDDAHLLRIFLGGAGNAALLERSDQAILDAALSDLRDLIGLRDAPLWHTVDRWPASMAQYHLGHRDRVAHIRTRCAAIPGLALVGNGYEGVGIPDVIAQANATAARWLTSPNQS